MCWIPGVPPRENTGSAKGANSPRIEFSIPLTSSERRLRDNAQLLDWVRCPPRGVSPLTFPTACANRNRNRNTELPRHSKRERHSRGQSRPRAEFKLAQVPTLSHSLSRIVASGSHSRAANYPEPSGIGDYYREFFIEQRLRASIILSGEWF